MDQSVDDSLKLHIYGENIDPMKLNIAFWFNFGCQYWMEEKYARFTNDFIWRRGMTLYNVYKPKCCDWRVTIMVGNYLCYRHLPGTFIGEAMGEN